MKLCRGISTSLISPLSNSIGNSKLLEDEEEDEADDDEEEEEEEEATNGIGRTSTTSLLELELESAGGTGLHELEELLELEELELSEELIGELDSPLEESSRR